MAESTREEDEHLSSLLTEVNSLEEIPEELLLAIMEKLSLRDLATLVRVSRDFWRIGEPVVWRDLDGPPFLMLLRGMQQALVAPDGSLTTVSSGSPQRDGSNTSAA